MEGPVAGLRRQRHFARNAHGCVPTALTQICEENEFVNEGNGNGVGFGQLISSRGGPLGNAMAPANAQQEADDEDAAWEVAWGSGVDLPSLVWPMGLFGGPEIMEDMFDKACATLPIEMCLV